MHCKVDSNPLSVRDLYKQSRRLDLAVELYSTSCWAFSAIRVAVPAMANANVHTGSVEHQQLLQSTQTLVGSVQQSAL
eukprot:3284-Heterococcus_DN1.PRE.1